MANNRIRFSNDFILKDEKVGINTTEPRAELDVGGDLYVSGIVSATEFVGDGTNLTGLFPNTIEDISVDNIYYPLLSPVISGTISSISVSSSSIVFNPELNYLGIGTTNPQASLELHTQDGIVRFGDVSDYNGTTDNGISFIPFNSGSGGITSHKASVFTEINGRLLSFGVNVLQVEEERDSNYAGGLVRIDTRSTGNWSDSNVFSIKRQPVGIATSQGDSGEINGLVVNLNSGNTYTVPNGGKLIVGTASTLSLLSSGPTPPIDVGDDIKLQVGFASSEQGAYISGNVGIGTTNPTEKLDIDGNTLVEGDIIVGSTIGAASTEKMEISAVSRDNGLLEIANYGGNQLFSVSNDQSESAFSIYRYANYENLSITSFENRNLFSVSPLGIVTTYGALRVGTSNTIADSSVYNELYGRLNVRAPFSTATEYVSIVPKFSDKGALSFEAPVGTAQTDRGTQIFSISNNLDSSIFRVNDLNRNPIFEASASGNAGIGTTNPQVGLDVATEAQFRNRVGFSQTANPDDTSVIDIQSYTPGITTFFNDSAVVITSNRNNDGRNRSQVYTIEDNDNTIFRVNVVGFGLTTVTTPTTPIYRALDIDSNHNVNIFDTTYADVVKQISGFSTTNPVVGDSDMFRVDAFSSPFIGSFPTVSKALRVDKFGLIEVNRDINQISGIATVGLGSTSSPSLNSTMSFELTNNTTLTVRVKGTDGVVRTGTITLS